MLETNSLHSSMEATPHHQSLQPLAQQLQAYTRSLPNATLMEIQCVVKQGNLMVLGQHPPDDTPEPQIVFYALEQAIHALLPTCSELALGSDVSAQAKLYLRVLGERQPYASHSVPLRLPTQESLLATESTEVAAPETKEPTASLVETSDRIVSNQEHTNEASATTDSIYDPTYVEASDLTQLDLALEPSIGETPSRQARSALIPWLLAGIGVSVAGFTAGLWVMSRPCVLRACEPLQTAHTLSQQSLQIMETAKTGQELQQAQQKLTEATRLLQSVPAWSSHHGDAQALQQAYQPHVQTLDRVLAAESKADTATQKSQALPQPIATLQATQAVWREAIAQLQTVPQTDALFAFAQQHLAAYETNRAAIATLITAEQQAQKKLSLAKETVKVADARQGIAQTSDSWQLAQSTWQVAINTLRGIPTSTTSYTEAQQLLAGYQGKLAAARDRATQEQIAKKAFTQALALAQRAEAVQRQNQWSQAVATWRDALTTIKQVPNNTAYSDPAQPLVASYGTSLKQAEAQLQVAAATQRTRDDLSRICTGSPRMCSYTIANNVIRVQFTPAYERQLRTAFVVGQAGDKGTLGGVANHIETLQTALQTIADNAGLPLEVYSADGSELIGSFNPKG